MESPSPRPQRAMLIASPRVYHDEPLKENIGELLRQHGITLAQFASVDTLDGKPPLGAAWREAGIDLVIAAGGDGTLGGAATHVAWSDLPLGILPLGTSNDFARSLHLPLDLAGACQTIAQGHTLTIDLGRAQPALAAPYALHEASEHPNLFPPADTSPEAGQAFFTHALTLGLNVTFARLATNATLRQRLGALTYPVAALGTLGIHQPIDFTLTFHQPACQLEREEASEEEIEPERPYHYRALQVAVINSPVFGGQFGFALAGVQLQDHLLDIVIVEKLEKRQFLAAALTALMPPKDGHREAESRLFPSVRHFKARAITIETPEPLDVTLDGELRGRTPIQVVSAARALKVLAPTNGDGPVEHPGEQEEMRGTTSG